MTPMCFLLNALSHTKAVVLLLLFCCLVCFPLVVGFLCLSLFCCALHCVLSSFAIISKRKRESWLLCFYCLTNVLILQMFCDSSSRCRGLVCGVRLWHFLLILFYFMIEHISFLETAILRVKYFYMYRILMNTLFYIPSRTLRMYNVDDKCATWRKTVIYF